MTASTLAREYANSLAKMRERSWSELREGYGLGTLSDADALTLIHPTWYGGSGRDGDCPVRGKDRFGLVAPPSVPCECERFWGYRCPFSHAPRHCDHVFPYRLGGPTEPANGAWLCSDHNLAKAGDWHVSIQPINELGWFQRTLARVELEMERLSR